MIEMRCAAGHDYDVIKTIQYDPRDLEFCPICGAQSSRRVSAVAERVYTQFATPEQHAYRMENRQWLESRSEDILSGKLGIKEVGPKEYRPKMPDHLKKYSK